MPRRVTASGALLFFFPGDLLPVMCDRAGFIQDTSLILYEVRTVYFCVIGMSLVVWRGLLFVLLASHFLCVMPAAEWRPWVTLS